MAEKRLNAKALRALTAADLAAQVDALRRQRWEHRLKLRDGSARQTHLVRELRRQAARALTAMNEQRRAAARLQETTS